MRRLALAPLALSLALSGGALASDHTNLERDLPVRIEDAYVLGYGGREFQSLLRYERTGAGKDRYLIDGRYEVGFARNWQARVSVPYQFGDADKRGGGYPSGNVSAEIFYNFNTESLDLPAFALALSERFPTGTGGDSYETGVEFIATRTLRGSPAFQRVHANLGATFASSPGPGERRTRLDATLGYQRRIQTMTMLIGDVFWEQGRRSDEESYVAELGLRRQYDPLTVISFGLGAGLNRDAPKYRATLSIQRSF